jgi:hypothetical protein
MLQFPEHLLNATALNNFADDAVHGLGGVRPPTLSIARQVFTAIDAGGNEKNVSAFDQTQGSPTFGRVYVDVIFVDANPNLSHTYYAGKYDPGATEFSPPDCFSDNGIAPSDQATTPQSATCQACPHAVWGSAISERGSQTKACRDAKKVALLIPASGSEIPFLLRVPPASLNKQFAPYIRMLAQQNMGPRKLTPADVVTRITFDAQEQGVLNFAPVGFITPEQLILVQKAQAPDAITAQIVGKNDKPFQGALPAPAAQPAAQIQQQPVQQTSVQQTPVQQTGFMAPVQSQVGVLQQAAQQQVPVQEAQPAAPARTRRGRQNPPAQQPAQAPVQQTPVDDNPPPPNTPAFLLNGAQPAPQVQQPQQAAQPTHGIVNAPPPTGELANALAAAFGNGGN